MRDRNNVKSNMDSDLGSMKSRNEQSSNDRGEQLDRSYSSSSKTRGEQSDVSSSTRNRDELSGSTSSSRNRDEQSGYSSSSRNRDVSSDSSSSTSRSSNRDSRDDVRGESLDDIRRNVGNRQDEPLKNNDRSGSRH